MVEKYSFGSIVIDGQHYHNDVLVLKKGIKSWWRKEGHLVSLPDIEEIIKDRPEVVIFGQGSPGLMKVSPEVKETLEKGGSKVIILPTSEAVKRYNEALESKKRVVGAFHLTC